MKEIKDKVVLIGMPGCGKSTLGKVLAREINYNFYDMDDYVKQITNKDIPELFAKGEEVFRDWETTACKELVNKKRVVISSGGGVVKRNENIQLLREKSIIIFIDRPLENIAEDIEVSTRPLLKDGKEKLYKLYEERYELYKKAAHIIVCNDGYAKDAIEMCKKELKGLIRE